MCPGEVGSLCVPSTATQAVLCASVVSLWGVLTLLLVAYKYRHSLYDR